MYKKLSKNATIGVVGVSNSTKRENKESIFQKAKKLFEDHGYKLKFSDNVFIDYYGMAGSAKQKAEELNNMFKDSSIDLIMCLDGGDSCNTIIDYLDYELIKNNPKPIVGYSDITVLLETINKMTGIITFHGPAFLSFGEDYGEKCMENFVNTFEKGLFDDFLNSNIKEVRKGNSKGKLIGTNLECSIYIIGTKYFPDAENNILLVERYITTPSETYNHFYQLKQKGILDKISGLLIGYNYSFESEKSSRKTDIKMEDIAKEVSKDYDFPIYKCETFGHEMANVVIPVGATAEIIDNKLKITEKIFF